MEKKVFFLLKVKTKIKARWIEHIIKTQIGVNLAIVNYDKRVILIEFDAKLITIQYMRMLVRSLGCDLVLDDKEIRNRQNQLGNFLVLKKRKTIFFSIFLISILGFICPFYNWLLFVVSILMFVLYLSLFIYVSNKHFVRSFRLIDRIGLLFSFLFIVIGAIRMFYFSDSKVVFLYFFISIVIIQLISFYRWIEEKKIAEIDLL
ncbi:hypothetical protein [uncultured Bacteroides sp.]|uniref:hypothetical protein n=1 Tax=uncultured Bacteroides sp. TaxID=162156 RepID=UPI002AAC2874|nr:hypothetical protein [uncultured Bacteroides sp.]